MKKKKEKIIEVASTDIGKRMKREKGQHETNLLIRESLRDLVRQSDSVTEFTHFLIEECLDVEED